jgi:phosphatidate cytidylyltransferase
MNSTLTRAISGLIYIVILLSATLYSYTTFVGFFGILLTICAYEFSKLVKINPYKSIGIVLFFYLLSQFITLQETFYLLLFFALISIVKAMLFLFDNNVQEMQNSTKFNYLLGYLGIPFILITQIPLYEGLYQPKVVISLFILIWVNDTFAYLVGKSIGKTKLFEKVSPKKTIEGFFGGFV